jgi:polyisoprenoid-binding protein YceI
VSEANTRVLEGLTIPTPGTFVLDPYHTRIGFSAKHLMVSRVRGRFSEFAGKIIVAEDPLQSSAELVVNTLSVDTGVAMRDSDLKSENFLNVEKYPQMAFHTTRVTGREGLEFTVAGELTIKDVTRPVELTVEIEGVTDKPAVMGGKQIIGFTITGEIDREDWGMTYNMALEAGGFVVSKKIRLEIEGEAERED